MADGGGLTLTDGISYVSALSSVLLYTTGWPAVRMVTNRQNTGDMSTFPYVAMFVNCSLWIVYGLLVSNTVLLSVNTIGAAHQAIFISVFYWYTKSKKLFNQQLLYPLLFLLSMYIYVYMGKDRPHVIHILGSISSGMVVLVYAAPLAAMGHVFSTKSTSSMNFALCVANFIVSVEWTTYGHLLGDNFVMAPNLLGVFVSLAQLLLFWIYPHSPPSPVIPL